MAAESTQNPLLLILHETLISCSKSIEGGDFRQSDSSFSELLNFLDSVSNAALSDPDDKDAENNAFEVLSQLNRHLCTPSQDQAIIDAFSFELPRAVAKFGGVSGRCLGIADAIIDQFIVMCNPRDMITILCEALASSSNTIKASSYFSPLLSGLSKAFLSIQRRHFEQVKEAVRIILNVLKAVSPESDDGDMDFEDLSDRALGIADSMHAVCQKLEGQAKEKLCALLGLYVLQIMALATISMRCDVSNCPPMVSQLSHFLPYCGLSYLGLITGSDVDTMTSIVVGEDEDDYAGCLSYVKHGASLSVIWGSLSNEVAQAAEEDFTAVKIELQSNQTKRWQAVGVLKHIFSSINLPWELKKHGINFVLCITEGDISQTCADKHADFLPYMPSLFAALQAIEMVIMYAPDAVLRRSAFEALKRVLADIPTSQRFDVLKALITISNSSSMIAILLGLVKEEMRREICQRISTGNDEVLQANNNAYQNSLFWSDSVVELLEFILRPPKGGPPLLPDQSDAVLSALNLYRYVLITESAGKSNYTGVLSEKNLRKAFAWFLPLRTLVTGIMTENKNDYDQLAVDTACALNPLELVLYRCIELVEEKMSLVKKS